MKVLIGYDGLDDAKWAVEALSGATLPPQAEAVILTPVQVWPPLPASCFRLGAADEGRLLNMARALAHLALAEATATAKDGARRVALLFPDWVIRPETCLEPLAVALPKKAAEWGADYLFASKGELRQGGVPTQPLKRAGLSLNPSFTGKEA